jgi:tRNA (cmo5U34)-methyltransferase
VADHVWKGDGYLEDIVEEVPQYERLQDELAAATADLHPARILDLGTGTGETARRVLALHPDAQLVGLDDSPDMLGHALRVLPHERVRLQVGRIEGTLPPGPFDLVTSGLCVHHLDGPGKAALFRSLHAVVAPGGRVVIGDLVVPEDPADVVTPVDWDYDLPSSAAEQLAWLRDAGFAARVAWAERDLAVLVGDRPG